MISEPTRTSRLKLTTRPTTTATGRATAAAPPAVPRARPLWCPGGEDHRQDRDDARRDPGDEPGDEPDPDQLDHVQVLPLTDEVQPGRDLGKVAIGMAATRNIHPAGARRAVDAVHRQGTPGRHPGRRRRSGKQVRAGGHRERAGRGGDQRDDPWTR